MRKGNPYQILRSNRERKEEGCMRGTKREEPETKQIAFPAHPA
jgi:hypothetical protein